MTTRDEEIVEQIEEQLKETISQAAEMMVCDIERHSKVSRLEASRMVKAAFKDALNKILECGEIEFLRALPALPILKLANAIGMSVEDVTRLKKENPEALRFMT